MNNTLLKISLWVTKERSMSFHIIVGLCTGFIWNILYFVCKYYISTLEDNPNEEYTRYIEKKQSQINRDMARKKLICSNCHSDNIKVELISELKKRSFLSILLYIILACTIIGLILLIPLLRGQKTKTKKYCICQNCGNSW